MRTILLSVLLLTTMLLAACQNAGGPSQPRDPAYRERYGSICSPYASNCW